MFVNPLITYIFDVGKYFGKGQFVGIRRKDKLKHRSDADPMVIQIVCNKNLSQKWNIISLSCRQILMNFSCSYTFIAPDVFNRFKRVLKDTSVYR